MKKIATQFLVDVMSCIYRIYRYLEYFCLAIFIYKSRVEEAAGIKKSE